jgi:hypothetical protein
MVLALVHGPDSAPGVPPISSACSVIVTSEPLSTDPPPYAYVHATDARLVLACEYTSALCTSAAPPVRVKSASQCAVRYRVLILTKRRSRESPRMHEPPGADQNGSHATRSAANVPSMDTSCGPAVIPATAQSAHAMYPGGGHVTGVPGHASLVTSWCAYGKIFSMTEPTIVRGDPPHESVHGSTAGCGSASASTGPVPRNGNEQ